MKKLFLAIYFIALTLPHQVFADVISIVGDPSNYPQQKNTGTIVDVDNLPDPNNQEEVHNFFKKRFEEAARSADVENQNFGNGTIINVIRSPEYYEQEKANNKSTFEKMYDEAIASIHKKENAPNTNNTPDSNLAENEQNTADSATRFFKLAPNQAENAQTMPKIPTVSVTLPNGRRILAPTDEHIPYIMSYLDIMANGFVKVEETIIIVANNNKFAYGLQRIFPKFSFNSKNEKKRIEVILNNVTINNTKVPYITEEIGNELILKPRYNQKLEPGVYTYKFEYMVDNILEKEDKFVSLDWNITGVAMNAFITSANIILTLPEGHSFSDWLTVIGTKDTPDYNRANMFHLAKNVLAVSSVTPILNLENMNIITTMDHNVFINNFDKTFSHFLNDWGNILYAGLGLITILISFLLSLFSLKKDKKTLKFSPSYNGSLMRSILIGKYDRIAFVSQILELYRKGALDIEMDNNRIFLNKLNTKSSKLNKIEKKALKILFAKKAQKVEVNNFNNQKIKKVHKIFEKLINKQIKKFRLIHNISYVLFSIAMLILTEFFIAFISVNFAQSIIIMLSSSLLYAFYIWILRHKFKYRLIGIPFKIFAILAIIGIWVFSSIYIGKITGLIIIAMVFTIFEFNNIFGEQNNFINDAKTTIGNYKEYLVSSAGAINLSRDFANQQANIFALSISEHYEQNVSNRSYYRLDLAENLKQSLIGII